MINKQNISKIYFLFLSTHIFIWTVVPTIFNINLLDTIEALAWGSNMDWGLKNIHHLVLLQLIFFTEYLVTRIGHIIC